MHILLVIDRLSQGDVARLGSAFARAAARKGHLVTCLTHNIDNRLLTEPNLEWVEMPDSKSPTPWIGRLLFSHACTRWIRRYGQDADLILTREDLPASLSTSVRNANSDSDSFSGDFHTQLGFRDKLKKANTPPSLDAPYDQK